MEIALTNLHLKFQKLLKEGGKLAIDELKLISNTEELKAKEFASVVEKLQVAIKREQQIKVMKQVNEKQKQVSEHIDVDARKQCTIIITLLYSFAEQIPVWSFWPTAIAAAIDRPIRCPWPERRAERTRELEVAESAEHFGAQGAQRQDDEEEKPKAE